MSPWASLKSVALILPKRGASGKGRGGGEREKEVSLALVLLLVTILNNYGCPSLELNLEFFAGELLVACVCFMFEDCCPRQEA